MITGSVTGVMTLSKSSALTNACASRVCGPPEHSNLASANTLATVSDIAFAAAGVGAVVAVVSLAVGHQPSVEPHVESPPAPGPMARLWVGFGAAGLRGTF